MKETNFIKLEKVFDSNGGYITRKNLLEKHISTWFLSDFVKRKGLIKIAPGIYANEKYLIDEYFILQQRFPKYIFSGISALYLLRLTDKIPQFIEVSAPQGYNPSRDKIKNLVIKRYSKNEKYLLGVIKVETMFSNIVYAYDKERTICDLIKNRKKYDSETFIKAIKYSERSLNQMKLFEYAKKLGIEKAVFEIFEIISNVN